MATPNRHVDLVWNRGRAINLLVSIMERLWNEEQLPARARGARHKKRQMSDGFSSMLGNLSSSGHHGYSRLNPEEDPPRGGGGQIILDPHAPLAWNTKRPFVQKPSRFGTMDALHSLRDDFEPEEKIENALVASHFSLHEGPPEPPSNSETLNSDNGNKAEEADKSRRKHEKFMGIFLAAISGLFFTLCSVMVKLLKRIDPSEVLLFRALVQLVITIPIMAMMRANPLGPKGSRLLVYLQGLIGCLTVTCIFIGFARLPVGDAATIIFCSPIFVMIFSHVILREHCGLYRVFVILLLTFGVVLIAKPPFLEKLLFPNNNTQIQSHQLDVIGYGAAMGGTLLTASNFVCMRKLRGIHFSVLIFAFSVMSATLSAVIVALTPGAEFLLPRSIEEWVYAILVGIFGILGQALLAMALRYETAGLVAVTRSMDIAVAYIIQITWFGDMPLWTSILGALVVILAVAVMAFEESFLGLLKNTCGSHGWC